MRVLKIGLVAGLIASNSFVFADRTSTAIQITNPEELMKRAGTDKFPAPKNPETLKIAVLDIGFAHKKDLSQYLPESARLIDHDDYPADLQEKCAFVPQPIKTKYPLDKLLDHGLRMAQAVWTVMGKPAAGPQFLLLNAAGMYNFRRAICYVIQEKVDIVLYSQNWETGTNFKGGGFINKLVNHALDAGILWVNAAGNYANQIYSGPITIGKDGFLTFRNGKDTLRFASLRGENRLAVSLNWDDVGDEEDSGTERDLNLYVYDKAGLKSGIPHLKSEKVQVLKKERLDSEKSETFLAREKIPSKLGATDEDFGQGEYYIKVQAAAGRFLETDRLRITVNAELGGSSEASIFYDATGDDEVMGPADNTHPNLFAVSDPLPTSSRGQRINGVQKPDVLIGDSRMQFDGQFQGGASHAAAIFAGILGTMKLYMPSLDAAVIRHFLKRTRQGKFLDAENTDSFPVDPREIQHKFSSDLTALKENGSGELLVFRRRSSGRYVIGIENDPAAMTKVFGELPKDSIARDFTFYTSNDGKNARGNIQISGHAQRSTPSLETPVDPPPWLMSGRNEIDFLEVRKMRIQPRIYHPVTPQELDRVVRQ